MIDGIKIDVPNLLGAEWLSNDLLEFFTYTSAKTGELLDGSQAANYWGLTFVITTSNKPPRVNYCSVRGSLHKYFNKGNHNANDFTFNDLQEVLKDLQIKFNIAPKDTILRNVEFGVNIKTPISVKEVLNNLVAHGNAPFGSLKVDGMQLGKFIGKQQYRAKVYDKGKQYNRPENNLTRIEFAVKKMKYLQPYGITTLADLQDSDKVQALGKLITAFWDNLIYYDKKINWKQLTDFERKKLLYYAASRNWQDFNPTQRTRAKKHFQQLISKYGAANSQAEISNLIGLKWKQMGNKKRTRINRIISENGSKEMYMIYPLEYRDKIYTNGGKEINLKIAENTPLKKNGNLTGKNPNKNYQKCQTCKKDISGKKAGALYCSKKCNNSYQAKKRKYTRHNLKFIETSQLNKLLAHLNRARLVLLVEYQDGGNPYADTLHQREITAPPQWVRKVTRVTIQNKAPRAVLTSFRAKKLIRIISNLNK
jgi:hypothetical protein